MFVLGLLIGGFIGVIIMACVTASSDKDKKEL